MRQEHWRYIDRKLYDGTDKINTDLDWSVSEWVDISDAQVFTVNQDVLSSDLLKSALPKEDE